MRGRTTPHVYPKPPDKTFQTTEGWKSERSVFVREDPKTKKPSFPYLHHLDYAVALALVAGLIYLLVRRRSSKSSQAPRT
jgi:hypothetical protein